MMLQNYPLTSICSHVHLHTNPCTLTYIIHTHNNSGDDNNKVSQAVSILYQPLHVYECVIKTKCRNEAGDAHFHKQICAM